MIQKNKEMQYQPFKNWYLSIVRILALIECLIFNYFKFQFHFKFYLKFKLNLKFKFRSKSLKFSTVVI